jgi:ribonuclease HI
MNIPAPHFLLFSESSRKQRQGQWRFLLQAADGTQQLEAADAEPEMPGERLELLAVVRGLEALDQPSRVTLVTPSKYVHRGVLYGLEEWRTNGWSWEHFGQMVPVKNRDLWQRLDNAMTVHELRFEPWRVDPGSAAEREPSADDGPNATLAAAMLATVANAAQPEESGQLAMPRSRKRSAWGRRLANRWQRWFAIRLERAYLRLAIAIERLIPRMRVE